MFKWEAWIMSYVGLAEEQYISETDLSRFSRMSGMDITSDGMLISWSQLQKTADHVLWGVDDCKIMLLYLERLKRRLQKVFIS